MKNYIYSERVNLFEPNVYIQLYAQIAGKPVVDNLILAIKTAFEANEVTMSKIILTENGTAYYERMTESGCKVDVTHKDWKEIIKENEKLPFCIDKGELMRVFVILSETDTSLLIMAHHLAGDGKAIVYFLEDVMNALTSKQLEYKPMVLISPNSLQKESEIPLFFKIYANHFNRKWNKNSSIFTWKEYYKIHKVYWEKHSSEVIYETFTTEEVNKIRACAKTIGVSVNSCIMTAFLAANANICTMGLAVNVRSDRNRSISNQASGVSVDYKYSKKKSFEKNAKIIHRKVYNKIKHPIMKYFILRFMSLFIPTLIDSILLYTHGLYQNKVTKKLAKVMGYKGGKTRGVGISNLTKLDIPNIYGDYRIQGTMFVPPVVSYAKNIIGISTTEAGMTVSYHMMISDSAINEEKFFRQGIMNIRDSLLNSFPKKE